MNDDVLIVENLTISFLTKNGVLPAVKGATFSIKRGETMGLVGESGSGKSTIAYALMGYMPENATINSNKFLFLGNDLLKLDYQGLRKLRSKNLAMVYQDPMSSLNPSLTVGFQISELIKNQKKISNRSAIEEGIQYLESVNIPDPKGSANKYPHQMSGGQLQRVVIAMALCHNPDLLILDEPTTGLDVTTEATILDLINDLKHRTNQSILFISHNLGVIRKVSDKVGVLYAGKMVEKGLSDDIFKQPLHPYTKALIECIPNISTKKDRKLQSIPGTLPNLTQPIPGCIYRDRCGFSQPECMETKPALEKAGGSRQVACLRYKEIQSKDAGEPVQNPTNTGIKETSQQKATNKEKIVLEIRELKKYYGSHSFLEKLVGKKPPLTRAVDNISFNVFQGESFGIVGESGCGKSTLATTICKLQKPSSGMIHYKDKNIWDTIKAEDKEYRRECQIVFQNPDSSLNPRKTIEEILERPLKLFKYGIKKERTKRVMDLLKLVNLDLRFLKNYPHELSGGQKQRIGIARAFAADPKIVIFDEPLSALDVSVQSSILNLLKDLQKKFDTTFLFISHDLSVVKYISHRICVMYLGKICEIGRTRKLFSNPMHPYTKALISAIPKVETDGGDEDEIRLKGVIPSAKNPPNGCRFHTRCQDKIGDICESVTPKQTIISGDQHVYCHLYR